MVAGFLFSRSLLSIFTFGLGVNGLVGIHPRQWLKNKWWLAGVAWIAIYAISWFWTEEKGNWNTRLEVKLPFLILPLAFAYLPRFTSRQLQIITLGMGLLFAGSACYSLSFLIIDSEHYITGYKFSHVLPTLPKFDHIRASMATVLFIVWSVYAWPYLSTRRLRIVTAFIAIFLALFLHILAAKSGLVSLYLFLLLYGSYLAFWRRKLIGLLLVVAIPLSVMFAIRFIPTFRERANYIGYSIYMLRQGDRSGNIGDIARLMSYKIAADLIKEQPLIGHGAGDAKAVMDREYLAKYPDVPEYGRLLPHNQFLIVALSCGVPAMLLFAIWVFMPLATISRNRNGFFFFLVWFILFIQLMIEPVLEVQFGVFVYIFFLLLQKHETDSPERVAHL
ncbi:MAG: O-antigen ligase family protein [Bacteroidota bacterium]